MTEKDRLNADGLRNIDVQITEVKLIVFSCFVFYRSPVAVYFIFVE